MLDYDSDGDLDLCAADEGESLEQLDLPGVAPQVAGS